MKTPLATQVGLPLAFLIGLLNAASCDAPEQEKKPPPKPSMTVQDEPVSSSQKIPSPDQSCKEDKCDGGFRLYILPIKGIYPEGKYQFTINVEGFEYLTTCQVIETGDSPACEAQSDDGIFHFNIKYDDYEEGEQDWKGFRVRIVEHTEPHASLRGPEIVGITITGEHSFRASETFVPTYRHSTPWGKLENCGYCDVLEETLVMKVTLPENSG